MHSLPHNRERDESSNFAAALDDFRQLVRRSKEAEEMRARFESLSAAAAAEGGGGGGGSGAAAAAEDYRLKETITIKLTSVSIRRAPLPLRFISPFVF